MKKFTILFLFVVTFASCKKEIDTVPSPNGSELFVSATSAGTITKSTLQTLASLGGFGSFTSLIQYDVDFYKIIYKTNYKGNLVEASGLICIPKNTPVAPSILSAQHGTMFKDTEAPYNFPSLTAFTGFELIAAGGFITLIPDFLGYGISKDIVHPYYDQQLSGTSVVDMIKASKYYLQQQNIAASNRLFLMGYSEGGYVTMATQKEIETHPEHNLTVTAAAAGAGGYDLQNMLSGITIRTSYDDPSFLALILQSYNTTYNWNRPNTDFYKEPYASRIPALLDGSKTREEINAQLNTSPPALFNATFYANLQNASGETTLKQALQTNSFLNWVPKSPTRLYHGTADEAVFFSTSESTFNRFKAAGATNVQFFPIQGGTHDTSVLPMMENAIPWIQSLDK